MPAVGLVAALSYVNLSPSTLMSAKHADGLLAPGSSGACRPPPLHECSALAFSRRHARVRSAPQAFADLANSNSAERLCSPSAATLPDGLYCFMRSRKSCVALLVLANS